MSFNVTQCPACESTFNTNSRVLAAAAGKVRCGACLNVFEAIDNFLIPESADAEHSQDESVFVGNDPQEFFDPSSFLTRSALSETSDDKPEEQDPVDEHNLLQELEKSATVSEEFFVTVAEELQGRTDAPAPEQSHEDQELQIGQSEELRASLTDESIDEEFEEVILDSFTAEETNVDELTEDDSSGNSLEEHIESELTQTAAEETHITTEETAVHELTEDHRAESSVKEHIESEPPVTDPIDARLESNEPFIGIGLSASFTFNPHAPPEVRIGEAEPENPLTESTSSELPIDPGAANDVEFNEANEKPLPGAQAAVQEPDAQDPYDSVSPQPNDDASQAFDAEETTSESLPAADNENPTVHNESPGDEVNSMQSLGEQEKLSSESVTEDEEPAIEAAQTDTQAVETSNESLPAAESSASPEPIEDPAVDNESLNADSASPGDAAIDRQSSVEQDELETESVAEDQEPTIEAAQTSAEEVDEESTEAIRARALEAELSDDEALEAIPQENLAALGNMSTPVELLARKESRLLRSTLLFLSILLLGGVLSAQYLWQRMELYSQLPQLRPLYEVACGYLNCTLPEYADIDSIRSENLTVQTHPTLANGLMVNTVIRNTAAFEQPFPILILSFNSVENSIIALREFTSAEYLDPALRSIQAMPVETPVQIGLAIMDPGPEAVNYTLAFRWP